MSDGVDGSEQASDAFTFGDVAARSRRLGHIHHAGTLVHGQQKDSDTGQPLVNLSRGGEAVENRHSDVENHEVRAQLRDLFQGFQPVGGFAANFKAARLQNSSYTSTQRLMVIYNQNSQSTRSIPSPRGEAARLRVSKLYGDFPRDNPVDTLQGIPHATYREMEDFSYKSLAAGVSYWLATFSQMRDMRARWVMPAVALAEQAG